MWVNEEVHGGVVKISDSWTVLVVVHGFDTPTGNILPMSNLIISCSDRTSYEWQHIPAYLYGAFAVYMCPF